MAQLCQMTSEKNRGQANVALIFSAECASVFHQRRLKGNWSRCCESNICISAVYRSPASVAQSQWQSCPIPIFFQRFRRRASDCPLTRWQSRNSGTKPAKAENCDSAIAINAIVVAMQSGHKDATNARLALARGATLVPPESTSLSNLMSLAFGWYQGVQRTLLLIDIQPIISYLIPPEHIAVLCYLDLEISTKTNKVSTGVNSRETVQTTMEGLGFRILGNLFQSLIPVNLFSKD